MSVLEGVPIGLGTGVDHAVEMLAEVASCTEAALLCHGLDGKVTDFEQPLSELDPLAKQPLVRGGSSCGEEPTRKRPGTHGRSGGKILNRDRLVEMLL